MDGIDVVIARFDKFPEVVSEYSYPIYPDLKKILSGLAITKEVDLDSLVSSHFVLASEYAKAVSGALKRAKIPAKKIRAIGLHGQTIRHIPKLQATFQLGSGAALTALTGIDVVNDFRSGDMALGGEGAPLVPMFDFRYLRSKKKNRIVLNIGGIANITFLPANCREKEVMAFDTVPGNMIIDPLVEKYFDKPYDKEGKIAKKGKIDEKIVRKLLLSKYFHQRPPKSTGREMFGREYLKNFISLRPENAIATATELSARSIANAFDLLPQKTLRLHPTQIIASGGGVKNNFLCLRIKELLPDVEFKTSDEFGIPSQAKEALAFAWFAKAFLDDEYIHLPKTTGASKKIIVGSLSKGK
jgi:anhydro-N-acetylmuramic acid kinase